MAFALFRPDSISSGLQGYWKLDEASGQTRVDSSSNGNDLSNNGTVGALASDYWKTGENSATFGNGNHLSITDASQTGLEMDGSSFTLACFVRRGTDTNTPAFFSKNAASTDGYIFYPPAGDTRLNLYLNSTLYSTPTGVFQPSGDDRWQHVCVVRDVSAGNVQFYVDGNLVYTATSAVTLAGNAVDFQLGKYGSSSAYLGGDMKDAAVWNVALTPIQIKSLALGLDLTGLSYRPSNVSTAPTAWWKLNEISGNAEDSSGNSYDLTDTNTVGAGAGYTEAVGRDFESASTEYFTLASATWMNFSTDVSFFTWIKLETTSSDDIISRGNGGSSTPGFNFRLTSSSKLACRVGDNGSSTEITGNTTLSSGVWYHVGFRYIDSSTTLQIFIDGRVEMSNPSFDATPPITGSTALYLGASGTGTQSFDGVMQDAALWIDYALSDAEIKSLAAGIPLQTQGVVSYWKLDGGRQAKSCTANNNAEIDTDITDAFGNNDGCLILDDASDVDCGQSPDWEFGASDFTIDFWTRFDNAESSGVDYLCGMGVDGNNFFSLYVDHSSNNFHFKFRVSDTAIIDNQFGSQAYSNDTWYHFAIVKTRSIITLYVDGSAQGTINDTSTLQNFAAPWTIGSSYIQNGGVSYTDGYIDEFRISNIARWTSDFTPETSAYTTDANTMLLMHFDGSDASTTMTDDSADGSGTPTLTDVFSSNTLSDNNSVLSATGRVGDCADFELSNNEYLSITDGSQTGLDITTDFTVLCLMKAESSASNATLMSKWNATTGYALRFTAGNVFRLEIDGTGLETIDTVADGIWGHIAGRWDGSDRHIFIDGEESTTGSATSAPTSNSHDFNISGYNSASERFDGLIDEAIVCERWLRDEEIKNIYIKASLSKETTSLELALGGNQIIWVV